MTHGSLFSGIGGFDLAAEWMGWTNVFHCEFNEFGKKVLKKHWPNAISYGDIKTTDFTIHRGKIDILTGGFPCQPYSVAGKRKGKDDDRHLWPEMLRSIQEIKPKYVVGENVGGIVNWNRGMVFDEVQSDLEAQGYEVQPFILPACGVQAWHRRDRVWFIANYNQSSNSRAARENESQSKKEWLQKWNEIQQLSISDHLWVNSNNRSKRNKRSFEKKIPELKGLSWGKDSRVYANIEGRSDLSTPVLCRSYDGIPNGMDRVRAYGNAIVPQVAYEIFKAIEIIDNINKQ